MSTIIVKSAWPTNVSKMVGEVWMGMSQPPDFMKILWAGVEGIEGEGIKGLVLWNVDDSNIAEAYAYLRKDIARYFDIPGYTYSYRIWTEPQDALQMVGLM